MWKEDLSAKHNSHTGFWQKQIRFHINLKNLGLERRPAIRYIQYPWLEIFYNKDVISLKINLEIYLMQWCLEAEILNLPVQFLRDWADRPNKTPLNFENKKGVGLVHLFETSIGSNTLQVFVLYFK